MNGILTGAVHNTQPYAAVYYRDAPLDASHAIEWLYRPVVAWSEYGDPLVVDTVAKRVVVASDLEYFKQIEYAPMEEDDDGKKTDRPVEMECWYHD